jgi:hypothetical protein
MRINEASTRLRSEPIGRYAEVAVFPLPRGEAGRSGVPHVPGALFAQARLLNYAKIYAGISASLFRQ